LARKDNRGIVGGKGRDIQKESGCTGGGYLAPLRKRKNKSGFDKEKAISFGGKGEKKGVDTGGPRSLDGTGGGVEIRNGGPPPFF